MQQQKLLPASAVAKRYGVHRGSLLRWGKDSKLGFPTPIRIRGRRYYAEADLDAFDRAKRRDKP